MAGARALWRATGMTDADSGKPTIAVCNSFTQFVPGHVHLKDMGQLVARSIEAAGGGIVLVEEGDKILIDIPARKIDIDISAQALQIRREKMDASEKPWKPVSRVRKVSLALKAYALLATSADKGAVRDASKLED